MIRRLILYCSMRIRKVLQWHEAEDYGEDHSGFGHITIGDYKGSKVFRSQKKRIPFVSVRSD